MADLDIDLLVLITVSRSQSKKLMANLNQEHFYFTIIDSTSSLFYEPTVLLLLGLNHKRYEALNQLVNQHCQPCHKFIPVQIRASAESTHLPLLETTEGGATVFSIHVEHFEQI